MIYFFARKSTIIPYWSKSLLVLLFSIMLLFPYPSIHCEELNIENCIREALEQSESLKSQKAAVDAADYDKNEITSWFFPQAKVSYNYMELGYHGEPEAQVLPTDPPIPFAIPLPDKQHSIEFSAVQPLTALWVINLGHSMKQNASDIEKNKLQLNTNQLKTLITEYYYSYFMLEENIELLNQSLEFLKEYRNIANQFISEGMSDKRAVLKIEIEIAKIKKELKKALEMQSVIKTAIAMYINREETSFSLKPINKKPLQLSASYRDLIDIQNKYRPELQILKNSEKIYETLYQKSWSEMFPNVALVAGYTNDFAPTSMTPEGTAYIGGAAEWEFGSQLFSKYSKSKKAKAELIKVKLDRIANRKQMQLQIKSLLSDIQVRESEIVISQKEIREAKENLRIEESKYREKVTTETDLLNALLLLKKATTAKVTSYYNHRIAIARLAGTIGVDTDKITKIVSN